MSDLRLREYATRTLMDLMLAHWRNRPAGRRYYSLTLYDEMGVSLSRAPQLAIKALKGRVDKAVRTGPLSALVQLELQPVTNYPQNARGSALLLHAHGVAWTDDPSWSKHPVAEAEKWAKSLNEGSWSTRMGGDPVKAKHVGPTETDILTVCAYASKVPHDGKVRFPPTEDRPIPRLENTEQVPPAIMLRIAEGLSQIAFNDAIMSVNADMIGRQWRKIVLDWHRSRVARHRCEAIGSPSAVAQEWSAMREHNGTVHYRQPFEFLSSGARPASIHDEARQDAQA